MVEKIKVLYKEIENLGAVNLLTIFFILMQLAGFLESATMPLGSEGYTLSYTLETWGPRFLYPAIAFLLLRNANWDSGKRLSMLSVPFAGAIMALVLQLSTGTLSPAIIAACFFVFFIDHNPPELSLGEGCKYLICYLILPIVFLVSLFLVEWMGLLPGKLHYLMDVKNNNGLFRGESFRGFARDRIAYSYLCGVALLCILARHEKRVADFIWMGLLLVALSLASSRAALVALALSLVFVFAFDKRSLRFLLAAILVVAVMVLVAASFSGRPDFLGDPGGRLTYIKSYMDTIQQKPWLLLTGERAFGANIVLEGGGMVRPHSWLLNSIINFGVLVTGCWMVFLFRFFKKINNHGRAIVIYFTTVGLFHNGFDAYLFSIEHLIGFLLAASVGGTWKEVEDKRFLSQ